MRHPRAQSSSSLNELKITANETIAHYLSVYPEEEQITDCTGNQNLAFPNKQRLDFDTWVQLLFLHRTIHAITQICTIIINSFWAFTSPADTCSFEAMGQQGEIDNLVQIHGTSFGGMTYLVVSFAVLCWCSKNSDMQWSCTTFQAHFAAFSKPDPFLSIL